MALINTARALDSDRFRWRATAAVLKVAAEKITSTDTEAKTYAQHILDHPMVEQQMFTSLCAVDTVVAGKVTVDPHTNTVDTEQVTDDELINAVRTRWDVVAQRHAEGVAS